jgi:multiple sugar transport system substrate-binding protein
VASLPIIGRPATVLHSDAYCMPKSGTNKDAAWQFLEFALGSEGETIAARTGRTVPSMKSVAASDAFLDPSAKPRNSQVFLDSIPNIRRLPNISVWPEIEKAMNQILEPAMYEAVPPDTLAAQLDAATKDIFARAQENQ